MDKETQKKLTELKDKFDRLAKKRSEVVLFKEGNKFEMEASNAYNAYAAFNNSIPGQPYIVIARNRGR